MISFFEICFETCVTINQGEEVSHLFSEELIIIHYAITYVYTYLDNEKFTESEVYQSRS